MSAPDDHRFDFPHVPIAEVTAFRADAPAGRFADRYMRTLDLVQPTDLGAGDLTADQRQVALRQFVQLKRPLTALALFWSVVALEDLIRDFGDRLAAIGEVKRVYPNAAELAMRPVRQKWRGAQPDKNAMTYLSVEVVNEKYEQVLGIRPLPAEHALRLFDLALVRHTIAHHGAIIRPVDVDRFHYYRVRPGQFINPPIEFVEETATFLHGLGQTLMDRVQARILEDLVEPIRPVDPTAPPPFVVRLIELFDYFGKLPTRRPELNPAPLTHGGDALNKEFARIQSELRSDLLQLCLADFA